MDAIVITLKTTEVEDKLLKKLISDYNKLRRSIMGMFDILEDASDWVIEEMVTTSMGKCGWGADVIERVIRDTLITAKVEPHASFRDYDPVVISHTKVLMTDYIKKGWMYPELRFNLVINEIDYIEPQVIGIGYLRNAGIKRTEVFVERRSAFYKVYIPYNKNRPTIAVKSILEHINLPVIIKYATDLNVADGERSFHSLTRKNKEAPIPQYIDIEKYRVERVRK